MQAAQITGGRVIYGRTVKTGDYENKRVDVELTFSTPEGEPHDATFAVVCEQVLAKAHAMLGITEKSNVVALRPAATNGAAAQPTDKDRLAAAAGLPADAKTETKPGDPAPAKTTRASRKPPAVAGGADPAAIGEAAPKADAADPAAIGGETQLQANVSDAADLGEDDLLTGSAPEISDEVLTTAITKKNAAVKNPVAIRQLIGRYTPQDGNAHQAREIEQGKRAAFIAELDTIKPLV